jgi:hypothetical protein
MVSMMLGLVVRLWPLGCVGMGLIPIQVDSISYGVSFSNHGLKQFQFPYHIILILLDLICVYQSQLFVVILSHF